MSLKKSVAAVISQNGFSFVVGFLNSVIATRILGPEGKGVFAIYTSSAELFALLLGIGVPHALLYFAARNTYHRAQVFNTALLFLFISTGVFLLVLKGSFVLGISEFFLPSSWNGSIYQFTLTAYFFCLLGWYLFVSILNGHKLFIESNLISVASIGTTLVLYSFAFYKYSLDQASISVTTFYWFQLTSAGLVLALCLYFYFRKISPREKEKSRFLNLSQTRTVLNYGFMYFLSNLMIFFSTKIDYWFVNYLLGPDDLGIYVLASNVGLLIILLPNAIGLVLSAYRAGSDTSMVNQQTAKICRLSFSGSLLLGIGLWLFGGVLIRILYGRDFELAAPVLSILLIGIIPYCVFTVLRGYFAGAGKLKLLVNASLVGLLLMLFLDLILIKQFGLMGAAIASAVAYVASSILLLHSFYRESGLPFSDLLFIKSQDLQEMSKILHSFFKA